MWILIIQECMFFTVMFDLVIEHLLAASAMLHVQGAALEALQAFFAALVSLGVKEASAPKLIDAIVSSAKSESHAAKQAAAQCIAALAIAEGASQVRMTVLYLHSRWSQFLFQHLPTCPCDKVSKCSLQS